MDILRMIFYRAFGDFIFPNIGIIAAISVVVIGVIVYLVIRKF